MNSKADDLNTFLKSLQDREIDGEDVAQINELRDVLKARYATVESKWISLSEEVDDPFKDQEEHDKCRGDYEKASVTLKKHLKAAKNALDRARDAGTAAPESNSNSTGGSGTSQPQRWMTCSSQKENWKTK